MAAGRSLPNQDRAPRVNASGGEAKKFIRVRGIQPGHERAGRPSLAPAFRVIAAHGIFFRDPSVVLSSVFKTSSAP
jgi:hypothetical protein